MYIGTELKKGLPELMEMDFNEVMLWIGYFTVKGEIAERERDIEAARRGVRRSKR
jgi:hypothetical protein